MVAHRIGQPVVVQADAQRPGELAELGEQVLPFPDAQVVDELVAAEPAELGGGELLLLLLEVVPQVQEAGEVRVLVPEAGVLLRRRAAACRGRSRGSWMVNAAARIMTSRTQPRFPASTIIRPSRGSTGSWASCCPTAVSPPPLLRARACRGRGGPSPRARPKAPSSRRSVTPSLMARESGGSTKGSSPRPWAPGHAHGRHLQDDRGQVGAQDLRVGELGPGLEVLLRVQPDGDAVGHAAAAAGALVGRGLGDPLDRQPLDLGPVQ